MDPPRWTSIEPLVSAYGHSLARQQCWTIIPSPRHPENCDAGRVLPPVTTRSHNWNRVATRAAGLVVTGPGIIKPGSSIINPVPVPQWHCNRMAGIINVVINLIISKGIHAFWSVSYFPLGWEVQICDDYDK